MRYSHLTTALLVGLAVGIGGTVFAQDQTNGSPETVMAEGLAPTRVADNGNAQITLFGESDSGFMGKLRVKPGAKLPQHTDKSDEFLYVLKGTGTLTVDSKTYDLSPNTAVYIPGGSKVSFENGGRVFEAVQFFSPPDSANKYSKWETGQVPFETERGARRGGGKSRNGSPSGE